MKKELNKTMKTTLNSVDVKYHTFTKDKINPVFDRQMEKLANEYGLSFTGSGFELKTGMRDLSFRAEAIKNISTIDEAKQFNIRKGQRCWLCKKIIKGDWCYNGHWWHDRCKYEDIKKLRVTRNRKIYIRQIFRPCQ